MPVSKTTIERPGAYHEFWQDWCDGDGVKDAEDINPLASKKQKPTREQKLFREAFFTYFASS